MSVEVKDVMGRVAIAVSKDAPFTEIIEAMQRYAVGAVTVIDTDRRPVGVVSEDDLLLKETDTVRHAVSVFESRRQRADHGKAAGVTAEELMTSPAVTVTPGTALREAAREMHARRIKQLPVIDPVTGRMVGTIHQSDVLRVFLRPAEELLAETLRTVRPPEGVTVAVENGVVTFAGRVARASQRIHLVEQTRQVEGVVDVMTHLTCDHDDTLMIVPPLL
ncbi:CBS domain-containing protein [Nonomuraea sp. NPDC050310]|uniref:CBS domain-containing protein n=1 Tax=Nonomuraea sp. NPDC050310 TaxID=3154935 RepID=UPI0033E698F8